MLNIGPAEMVVIGIVILLAVGPEQLPGVIRKVGSLISQVRSVTEGFKADFMASIEELEEAADIEKISKQVVDPFTDAVAETDPGKSDSGKSDNADGEAFDDSVYEERSEGSGSKNGSDDADAVPSPSAENDDDADEVDEATNDEVDTEVGINTSADDGDDDADSMNDDDDTGEFNRRDNGDTSDGPEVGAEGGHDEPSSNDAGTSSIDEATESTNGNGSQPESKPEPSAFEQAAAKEAKRVAKRKQAAAVVESMHNIEPLSVEAAGAADTSSELAVAEVDRNEEFDGPSVDSEGRP